MEAYSRTAFVSFCHNTLACSAYVVGILYFSFLTAFHPLSLLHFPPLLSTPDFSTPAFSAPPDASARCTFHNWTNKNMRWKIPLRGSCWFPTCESRDMVHVSSKCRCDKAKSSKSLKCDISSISENTKPINVKKRNIGTVITCYRMQCYDVIVNPTWRTAANTV